MKKTISLLTVSALILGSLSGCSLLGGKDKEAVTDTLTSYLEAIAKSKYGNSKKYVVDEEDYFLVHEFDGQTSGILEAVFGQTEFEITEIEVNKNSATAEVEFTMPDISSIADEGYSYEEFIDAIADIDDMTEETLEFELSKEDDEWLIEPDSTEDYFNFLIDLTDDLEFSGLSEEGAMQAVDSFIALLASGDVQGAMAMSPNFRDFTEGYAELGYNLDGSEDRMAEILTAYYTNLTYGLEIGDVSEDSITVLVTGTAPDAETAVNAAAHDINVLAPVAADYIEASLNGNVDMEFLLNELFDVVADAIASGDQIAYSSSAVVTVDEDGIYCVEPAENFMATFEFPGFMSGEDVVPAALDLLLEQGRITEQQYAEISGGVSASSSDYDVTDVLGTVGDDYYNHNVFVGDDYVEVHVQTWAYYNPGDVFNYEVVVNGSSAVLTGQFEMEATNSDIVEIHIPVDPSEGPYGNYQLTVHDEGSNTTSVLCDIEVIVLEQGAPITGDIGSGSSMTYDEQSDDVYAFHFVDGTGRWLEENDTITTDWDCVMFYTMTWDYYDAGSRMNCDVYYNGDLVDSISCVSSHDSNDTFEFSYEPSRGLSEGEYTFVLYDVNANSIYLTAYLTVED